VRRIQGWLGGVPTGAEVLPLGGGGIVVGSGTLSGAAPLGALPPAPAPGWNDLK
jgi:hypothetical protein